MLNNQYWTQSAFPNGGNENYDFFGTSLAAGDFDGDGYYDLSIGTPFEDLDNNTKSNAGKVNALYGSFSGLTSTGSQLWTQDDLTISPTEADDRFGEALAVGDFDGDGYDDLAVGAAFEDWGSTIDTGAVNTLYGSAFGLTLTGNQIWSQNEFPSGGNEAFDRFGTALTAGDFDGDGYDDLAIGTPFEDLDNNTKSNAGKVNILNGSFFGLTSVGSQLWTQDDLTISPTEADDRFGEALAVGDFDGDGYDDLAVGAAFEDWGATQDVGVVNTIYGSTFGLTSTGNQLWSQDDLTISPTEADDRFGETLAVGDFDGDGYDDLAVGAPDEDWGTITNAGVVNVIYGSFSGLTSVGNQLWSQDDLTGSPIEAYDRFGETLAVGDFDGDGYDDLAMGAPDEDWGTITNAGVVNVIYGSFSGLTSVGNQLWSQDDLIGSPIEAYDRFGSSLTVGDFNRDGYDDLAIGVADDTSGAVHTLYGSDNGLVAF